MALVAIWFAAMLVAVPRLGNGSLLLFTLAAGILGWELLLRTEAMYRFVEERDLAAFRRGPSRRPDPGLVPATCAKSPAARCSW